MSTLTTTEVVEQLNTSISLSVLQDIIDREEAALARLYGPAYDGTAITETILFEEGQEIFLKRRIGSITSVAEKASITDTSSTILVANSDYVAFSDEGRLLRLSGQRGQSVVVTYIPTDDTAEWKRVALELVRLAVERTAMKSENIAGEYSYQAVDWELERAKLLRQFGFVRI